MVERGADINIIDRRPASRFGTAWWGHSAIVIVFLDHDAHINAAAGRYWTAWQAASLRECTPVSVSTFALFRVDLYSSAVRFIFGTVNVFVDSGGTSASLRRQNQSVTNERGHQSVPDTRTMRRTGGRESGFESYETAR